MQIRTVEPKADETRKEEKAMTRDSESVARKPLVFVGDVHAKIDRLLSKLNGDEVFQLGDMGLGFKGVYLPKQKNLRFIRGNHDSPQKCQAHPNYAGEFGYDDKRKLFYLGGAFSIDYQWRTEGVSWWRDEELNPVQLQEAAKQYAEVKPKIVATHDCPDSVRIKLLREIAINFRPEKDVPTRTATALQAMFEQHKPDIWLFGHYHIDKDFEHEGTRFICLNELSTFEMAEEEVR